jgi:type II secretory pathway component GspD/PulD (secretin)
MVKAAVFEVRKEDRASSGVSLAIGLLKSVTGLGVAFDAGGDQFNGVRLLGSNFRAVWSALASDSSFRLVSSPVVRVKSGDSARFVAGSDVPTLGSVSYENGTPVRSIEYRSSGVIFEVSPEITSEAVSLSVKQQVSSFVRTETGVDDTPTLIKRELDTVITAKDDEVIILGGLEEIQLEEGKDGLSFLPDWLRGSRKNDSKTEIILMLHVQRI